jgi:hypothetical protein
LPILVCLSLCGWNVADGFQQAVVVEPYAPENVKYDVVNGFDKLMELVK